MSEHDPFDDLSPEQFLAWLEAQPPEFRVEVQQALLRRGPEAQVQAIRRLRAIAADPNASDKARADARLVLKKTGFDDESLREEND